MVNTATFEIYPSHFGDVARVQYITNEGKTAVAFLPADHVFLEEPDVLTAFMRQQIREEQGR